MNVDGSQFSLSGYENLVTELLARGYAIASFHKSEPLQRHLILRHDVDMSLDAAVALAQQENRIGVASTYFVLLRTEFYNVFSRRGGEAVRAIQALGHEIGLHFDAAYYAADDTDFADMAGRECDILEAVTSNYVRSFSLHRPHPAMLDRELVVPGRVNAYAARFFHEIGYCSDSRGAWHHGHPLDHPAVQEGRALQLLTHPIWWPAHAGEDVRGKLDGFLLRRFDLLRAELASNCGSYPQAFKNLIHKEN
jgi:hypothetical protein